MRRSAALSLIALLLPIAAHAQMGHSGNTDFVLRVENVSTPNTLKLSNGTTAPAPTAPILWVIHTNTNPIFEAGAYDRGQGLEMLAEDGDPSKLAAALKDRPGVVAVGAVAVPEGASEPGPILPGHAFVAHFSAAPGQRLTIAMMFGQSNDLFYAPDKKGIALFDDHGKPLSGDITGQLVLWDAGTEVNQEPGLGPDQAPRQAAPNSGASEHVKVGPVHDRYSYPKVAQVLRVTVMPHGEDMSSH